LPCSATSMVRMSASSSYLILYAISFPPNWIEGYDE
jgi:hypothetical protein